MQRLMLEKSAAKDTAQHWAARANLGARTAGDALPAQPGSGPGATVFIGLNQR